MSTVNRTPWGIYGMIVGGTFLLSWVVISWGLGWMSPGAAEKMAFEQSETDVKALAVAVLPDLCVKKARADADTAKITEIAAMESANAQIYALTNTEWIKFGDVKLSSSVMRAVAEKCQKDLFPPAAATNATPG